MLKSPDENARGLSDARLDALRYDGHTGDPNEVAGLMRNAMPKGARVLDVGCGTGGLTLIVNADKQNDVLGLEPDETRASVARTLGLKVVSSQFDREFVATQPPFDVIVFADVLEHSPAPAAMLQTAWGALKRGGLLLASVPNVAHWSVRANLLFGRFDYEPVGIMDATHLRWFTEKTLRSLIRSSGFEIVMLRYAAGTNLPVYYRSAFRFLPKSLKAPLVRLGAKALPRLFASQHVVIARKPTAIAEQGSSATYCA
ncbi:class I SAM-dependent methyltransferase [Sphingomonas segetis]|uniref:class I SAM-dependent methyltransferase n=1 Tax=Sphingomonas segetis TaxID=1104779 RepID=UPI0018AD3B6E|nr:class I SAM-dependent methyltransferase [Sphingomonas segetis]